MSRLSEAWARRDWLNLASIRNLWALAIGSFLAAAALAGITIYLIGETAGAVVLYVAWPVLAAVGAVFTAAYGIPRCPACGHRLRPGYYTCPACTWTTAPRHRR